MDRNKFSHHILPELYKEARMVLPDLGIAYVFSKQNRDYMEILIKAGTWFFVMYPYRRPCKYYSTNIPYLTQQDFESDLKRMDVPLPEENEYIWVKHEVEKMNASCVQRCIHCQEPIFDYNYTLTPLGPTPPKGFESGDVYIKFGQISITPPPATYKICTK